MASQTKKTWGSIAQWGLPILGALMGGPGGAALGGAAGGALSGKTGALKQAGLGALAGYGGAKVLGSVGGTLGKLFGGNAGPSVASAAALPKNAQIAMGTAFNPYTGAPSQVAQSAQKLAGQGTPKSNWFSGLLGGSGSGGGMGGTLGGIKSLLGNNMNTIGGLGSLLGGQLLPLPNVPGYPDSYENYKSQVSSGGTPVGQLGQEKLMGLLNTDLPGATEEELNAATYDLEQQKTDEVEQIKDLYRNLRPGTDPSTDASFRRDLAEVEDRYNRAITDTRSTLRRNVNNQNQTQRLNQIISSSGLNQVQLEALKDVATWDTARIMTQFNIDADSAQQLKDFLMSTGEQLFYKGIGLNESNLMDMFQ